MRLLSGIFFLLFPWIIFAQNEADTSIRLHEIRIVDTPLSLLSEGLDVRNIDRIRMQEYALNNLDELLQTSASVFVKSYGPGAISTLGFRGLGANQNVIYWNAIPLRSPNLGMLDISALPAGAFDEISVQQGGGAAILGAGNMSGGVFLTNKPLFKAENRLGCNLSISSIQNVRTALNYRRGGKKFYIRSQLEVFNDKNRFPYYDLHEILRLRQHAAKRKISYIQDMGYRIDEHQYFQSGIWLDSIASEVPGSLTSSTNDALQSGINRRFFVKYVYLKEAFQLRFQSSLLWSGMHYADPDSIAQLAVDSYMQTKVWQHNLNVSRAFNRYISLLSGLYYTYEWASSNNYALSPRRRQGGARLGAKIQTTGLTTNLLVSKEFVLPRSPVLFSFNSAVNISHSLRLKLHFSTNYRLPTFNDLYWMPLGNEHLLPERSKNYELGMNFRPQAGKSFRIAMNVTAFYYAFDERIVWLPSGGVWRPVNLGKVISRGLESHIEGRYVSGSWDYRISMETTYTLAKNKEYLMPYVPPLQMSLSNVLSFRGFRLHLISRYTSSFFTKTDNSYSLPAHYVTDVSISKMWQLHRHKLRIYFKVNNLFNADYQWIAYYPMPLRYYELRCSWDIDFSGRKRKQ